MTSLIFDKELKLWHFYFTTRCYHPRIEEYKLGASMALILYPMILDEKLGAVKCNMFITTLTFFLLQFQFSFTFNHHV